MTQIVKLNVGGIPYMTSLSTLTQYRDSMLGALVEHEQHLIQEGKELFIDRDGQIFRYVLAFLRNGDQVVLPEDVNVLRELMVEAEFYNLGGLAGLISKKLKGGTKEIPHTGGKPKWKVGDIITMKNLTENYSSPQDPYQIASFLNCGERIGNLFGTIMDLTAEHVAIKFSALFKLKENTNLLLISSSSYGGGPYGRSSGGPDLSSASLGSGPTVFKYRELSANFVFKRDRLREKPM